MEEYVILVDQNDNPIGKEEKVKCHLPNGKLHRAFSALIFNGEGKLLLTKRSESKMLWQMNGTELLQVIQGSLKPTCHLLNVECLKRLESTVK